MLRLLSSRVLRAGVPALQAGAPKQRFARRSYQPLEINAVSTPIPPRRAHTTSPGLAVPPLPLLPVLWQSYLVSLERRPLLTKSLTSFSLTILSDSVAQLLGGVAGYSLWRCVRLGLYSASVGALSAHYWHRWLDSTCHPQKPKSMQAVGSKLLLDQLLFAPVMTTAFLGFLKLAEGQPHLALPLIQEKLGSTLLAGYAVWPAVNLFIFRYIPADLRILAGSVCGLFWGTYMSLSCVNPSRACPEPGAHISGVMEGATPLQVLEK